MQCKMSMETQSSKQKEDRTRPESPVRRLENIETECLNVTEDSWCVSALQWWIFNVILSVNAVARVRKAVGLRFQIKKLNKIHIFQIISYHKIHL